MKKLTKKREWKSTVLNDKPIRRKKKIGKCILSAVLSIITAVTMLPCGFYGDAIFAAEKESTPGQEIELQINEVANIKSVTNYYKDFQYEILEDGTIAITGYTDNDPTDDSTEIEIPKKIQGKKVTRIDRDVFASRSLTSVSIPDGVTYIGSGAFAGCSHLISVSIPDSVTYIGGGAFAGCSLTSVDIPNDVTEINEYTFNGCSSLTNVDIPDSVTYIGNCAFQDCNSLTNVDIPNNVTYIGSSAFSGCSNLTNVDIPNSITYIDEETFKGCGSLTSVDIPNSVTKIGDRAFEDCSRLTSVDIPDSVTEIGILAFVCCSLTSVSIPNSVTKIGNRAFQGCSRLTSMDIPDSVTEIGGGLFQDCSHLTSVNIPNSVMYIGTDTFRRCSSLTNIRIPISVTKIYHSAFADCTSLRDVYYAGSKENWLNIEIDFGNKSLNEAIIHYDSIDSDIGNPDIPNSDIKFVPHGLVFESNGYCVANETSEYVGYMRLTDGLGEGLPITQGIADDYLHNISWETDTEDIIDKVKCTQLTSEEIQNYKSVFTDMGIYSDIEESINIVPFKVSVITKKYGDLTLTGKTENGFEASIKLKVLPNVEQIEMFDYINANVSDRRICKINIDRNDTEYIKYIKEHLKVLSYASPLTVYQSDANYQVNESEGSITLTLGFSPASIRGVTNFNVVYRFDDKDIPLFTFYVENLNGRINWSQEYPDGVESLNDDQRYMYDLAQSMVKDFDSKFKVFLEVVSGKLSDSVNVDKLSIDQLKTYLEKECGAEIGFFGDVTKEDKERVYSVFAKELINVLNKEIDKIAASDPKKVAPKIVNNVVNNWTPITGERKDGEATLNFNIYVYGSAFSGGIDYKRNPKSEAVTITVNMSRTKMTQVLTDYLDDLSEVALDSTNAIYTAMAEDLLGMSLKSFAGNLANDLAKKTVAKYADKLNDLGVKGFMDFSKNCFNIYNGINSIDFKKIVEFEDLKDVYDEVEKINKALGTEYEDFDYADAKKAGKKLYKATAEFLKELEVYALTGKKPKSLQERIKEKFSFKCPVNVYVYNSIGTQIGYITDDDEEYDEDSIIIDRVGNSKVISVLDGIDVSFKVEATDYGTLNCLFEEYSNGLVIGRLNYYDIDLTPDTEISVDAGNGGFVNNQSNLTMQSNTGMIMQPSAVTKVADYSMISINVEIDNEAGGIIAGIGNYVIGDTINLIALANNGYVFGGWYKDGNIFSLERDISFIAKESGKYSVRFIKLNNNDDNVSGKTVTLSKTVYTYNGEERKPKVTVIDNEGIKISSAYYTVSYSNNKKVGKATVTVTLKNGYSGTLKKNFTIQPKGTELSLLSGKSRSISVKWVRQKTQTTGYQIQYSTSSKFLKKATVTKTVKKNVATKLIAKKLNTKKTYYVRIRTYKIVNGKKYYSAWSKAKKVNTK